jgi:type IV secretion system T-DNA border endonuclease VirD2
LSRGVHERPVPDAEYRRARAAGREAVPPAHTEASAIATAAEILEYARDYQGAAAAIAEQAPELADRLEAAAATILAGRELAVEREAAPRLTTQEAMRMAETIEQIQAEVRQNFAEIEADIRSVREPVKRAEFLRDLAGLKAEAAPLIRDDMGLQGYRADVPHADYRGLVVPAGDARVAAIKAEADREVGRLAERFGLQPEATLARFSAESVSVGLGRDYRRGGAGGARGGPGHPGPAGRAGGRGGGEARRLPSPRRRDLQGSRGAIARLGARGPARRVGDARDARRRPRSR